MISKEIIKLNNEMREKLSQENKQIYEDMLVYIRLNMIKSEQQTEEVLFEILEHLLEAQENGKSAYDVFGSDIKKYCDELIKEIPGEKKSLAILFGVYITTLFLGIVSTFHGVSDFALFHLFGIGSDDFTFSLGTGILAILVDIIILIVFLLIVVKWMKNSTFKEKKHKKWVEFILLWIICTFFIGLAIIVPMTIPSFGIELTIPVITFAVIGTILFLTSFMLNKKYRLTK